MSTLLKSIFADIKNAMAGFFWKNRRQIDYEQIYLIRTWDINLAACDLHFSVGCFRCASLSYKTILF